jgi:hypothetical protein
MQYINYTRLKSERGWTDKLINNYLGEPDRIKRNPYYRTGAPMKLYLMSRVLPNECRLDFIKEMQKSFSAKQGGIKGTMTKSCKTLKFIENATISVTRIAIDELKRRALCHYNFVHGTALESMNCEPDFLLKIMRYQVRYELSNYHHLKDKLHGKVNNENAYRILNDRIMNEILRIYPEIN